MTTDEAEDVAGSIRQAIRMHSYVGTDEQAWKWYAIAIHSALQGSCVCHLTTSANPVGAVTKKNAIEWLNYFEASRTDSSVPTPATYLMTLPDLLKQVRKPGSAGGPSNGIQISLNDADLSWLTQFNDQIRNQFIHFAPMTWTIEVSGLPNLGALVARIVRQIVDCGYGFRHLSEEARASLVADLELLATSPPKP